MAFSHQYLPLLMLLERGKLMTFSTVFTYVLIVKVIIIFISFLSFSSSFNLLKYGIPCKITLHTDTYTYSVLLLLFIFETLDHFICRMELGAQSNTASQLSEILKMSVSIPTFHLWMICDRNRLQMELFMR